MRRLIALATFRYLDTVYPPGHEFDCDDTAADNFIMLGYAMPAPGLIQKASIKPPKTEKRG